MEEKSLLRRDNGGGRFHGNGVVVIILVEEGLNANVDELGNVGGNERCHFSYLKSFFFV